MENLLRDFKAKLTTACRNPRNVNMGRWNSYRNWLFTPRKIAERLVPDSETIEGRAALAELLVSHNTLGTALPPSGVYYSSIFQAIRINAINWLVDEANYWRELQMEELAMENVNPLLTEALK